MKIPIHILLIGASGRLGKAIITAANTLPTFQIKTQITRSCLWPDHLNSIDVVLDVSTSDALKNHLCKIVKAEKPLVIGTTGHCPQMLLEIHEASKSIPLLITSNFAPGMDLMKHLIAMFPKNSTTSIQEIHHTEKKDAPSGTAKDLAKLTKTPVNEILVERKEGVIGIHKVQLHLEDEILEISHTALCREVFAKGALKACHFLSNKVAGLYTSFHDETEKYHD